MILFLNFAPLTFGGGAERWICSVARDLAKKEKVQVIQVDSSISNIYAQAVLKRKFDNRFDATVPGVKQDYITWRSLIPYSPEWKRIRALMHRARIIYAKYEVNELLLLIYFGDVTVLRKTVFGLHSPFVYTHTPLGLLNKFHNIVYQSSFSKLFLSQVLKVHALNQDQARELIVSFGLSNVVVIPNFIQQDSAPHLKTAAGPLRVCFIGELSLRKGADVLIELMQREVPYLTFDVAGNGRLEQRFIHMQSRKMRYHGYINQKQIIAMLQSSDVLFMPSRAESFSLVCLEALSQGLVVVCSSDISTNTLGKYLEINTSGNLMEYLEILKKLYTNKLSGVLTRRRAKTASEVRKVFSKKGILSRLRREVFQI